MIDKFIMYLAITTMFSLGCLLLCGIGYLCGHLILDLRKKFKSDW